MDKETLSSDRVISALTEKIKKLEEYIVKDRESRRNELAREREREARALREALSPFYLSEQDARRKIADLQDKVDIYIDEHERLGERVSAIDATNTTLERRIQIWEDARGRKRKASLSTHGRVVMSPDSNYTSASSVESDTTSSSVNISPRPASPVNPPLQIGVVTPSPRSSGVLNHRATSRHNSQGRVHNQRHSQTSGGSGEPRSSGFLSIDLAQRMRTKQPKPVRTEERLLPVRGLPVGNEKFSSSSLSSELAAQAQSKASTGALPVSGLLSSSSSAPASDMRLAKKRKQEEDMMALDVLATASVSRPLADRA